MPAVASATGRATLAGQVEGDGPEERGYPGPPVWGLGVRLTTSPRKKKLIVTKPYNKPRNVMNTRRRQRTGSTDLTFGTWNEKDGNKRMERQSKESRGLEAYCKGGQGPPRAVAPPKKKKLLQIGYSLLKVFFFFRETRLLYPISTHTVETAVYNL